MTSLGEPGRKFVTKTLSVIIYDGVRQKRIYGGKGEGVVGGFHPRRECLKTSNFIYVNSIIVVGLFCK